MTQDARRAGLILQYYDAYGQLQSLSLETMNRVLKALPSLHLDQVSTPIVHRIGQSSEPPMHDGIDCDGGWSLWQGDREIASGNRFDDRLRTFDDLSPGTYELRLAEDAPSRLVLVAPSKSYEGEFDRVWVLAIQLYSLRSEKNWGIGDFSDLSTLLSLARDIGCAGIGLNPLHALCDDPSGDVSPYAPDSRLFLNPIYIDVTAAPGYIAAERGVMEAIAREKRSELIDHGTVWRIKRDALQRSFQRFLADPEETQRAAFDRFKRERGDLLARFSYFQAMRRVDARPWWEWPEEQRNPDDERLAETTTEREFVAYLQWVAHEQLQACSDLADRTGLAVGLYLDVAVGVRADGFDAWLERDAIARGLSIGAPPDLLNMAGQDWGLAGFNGPGLIARQFEPFRAMIEASARYAGAIRIDHVMGLARLFVVPAGMQPRDGAYVEMPLEPLLAITARESQTCRCIVIGEDLGTVPEGFRERLEEWGVWSYQVMMFERDAEGRFHQPEDFKKNALVTFNTHDLPSYAGWRHSHDLHVKRAIGIDPGESDDARSFAISALDLALTQNGFSPADFSSVTEFLGRAPSRILSVSLDDVVGVAEQINVPGTTDSHPNWRRRLPVTLDGLRESGELMHIAAVLAERRQP